MPELGLLFTRAQEVKAQSEPVFISREMINNDHPPVVVARRRFSDPVSPVNDEIHDAACLLLQAIRIIDHLGLTIISVDADRSRNHRVQVAYSSACDALEGVEVHRCADWSMWAANRYGTEIRWVIPAKAVA